MSNALSPYYKRIIRQPIATGRFATEGEVIRHSLRLADTFHKAAGPVGKSFAGRENLEELLLEGLASGPGQTMTPARKRRIYLEALEAAGVVPG